MSDEVDELAGVPDPRADEPFDQEALDGPPADVVPASQDGDRGPANGGSPSRQDAYRGPADGGAPPWQDAYRGPADGGTRPNGERPDPADELADELAAIRSTLDELVSAAAREQDRAAFRESVIDRLHTENQSLRRGELDAFLEPVRTGIVAVFDLARRGAAQLRRSAEDIGPERGAALLDAVADEAAEVLERAGVTRIDPVVGEPLDATRHRAVGTRPTTQPWQDDTVAEVSAPGFAAGDRTVRRAEVVAARHTGPHDTPDPGDTSGLHDTSDPHDTSGPHGTPDPHGTRDPNGAPGPYAIPGLRDSSRPRDTSDPHEHSEDPR